MKRAIAVLIAASGSALACGGSQDTAAPAPCEVLERRPVLLVHGSGLSSRSWDSLRDALLAAGYREDWVTAPDLEPNDGANVAAAERQLAPAALRLLSHVRSVAAGRPECRAPAKLDIVAHSMGAVSSRWFAARLHPHVVHTWVGIAPANHGTSRLCGYSGAGNRELCPPFAERGVQAELNGTSREPRDETPHGAGHDTRGVSVPPTAAARIHYYTLRIDPDDWIDPSDSALLDGAGGLDVRGLPRTLRETTPGNLLLVRSVSHDDLPGNEDVIAAVLVILTSRPSA